MNVYQAIAVISAALAVVAGAWDAFRLRRNHRYSAVGLAIAAGGPIVSLIVYLLVTNLALKQIVTIGLLALGVVAGVFVARRAALSEVGESGQIRLTGVAWLPLPAALSVGAIQICSAIGSLAGMITALAALEVSVGFGVTAAVGVMLKRSTIGASVAQPAPPVGPNPPPQVDPKPTLAPRPKPRKRKTATR